MQMDAPLFDGCWGIVVMATIAYGSDLMNGREPT